MAGEYRIAAPDPDEVGAVPIPVQVHCHVGTAVLNLTRPAGADLLCITAEKGRWRFRYGTHTDAGFPVAELPTASVTNGLASQGLKEDGSLVLPAPKLCSLKGYAADSVLTYFWL